MKPTESDTVSSNEFSFETTSSEVEVTLGERLRDFYEEFIHKPGMVAWADWRTRVGGLILLFYILMGTVGVYFYPAPTTNQVARGLKPFQSMAAPLGSTPLGENLLALTIHATDDILLMIVAGGVWATGLALLLGTLAGYKGGAVDRVLSGFMDIAMSIPGLPLIMVLAVVFSPQNPLLIGILITINYWAGLGRAIRSQVLTIREESYVEASRTMGLSTGRIMFKDVIPNVMPFVLINFVNAARYVIFASVGLYFIGVLPFGVQNWGITLNKAYNQGVLLSDGLLHWMLVPMLAILFLSLSLILLAQGMDRVFNPRARTRMAGESESTAAGDEGTGATGGVMQ
ncbi:MAG: ABC transporter permease [Haloarculaceae archaeon]